MESIAKSRKINLHKTIQRKCKKKKKKSINKLTFLEMKISSQNG